jgi:hypothetical protein
MPWLGKHLTLRPIAVATMAHIAMLANVQTSLRSLYILVTQAREDTVLPENDGLQTGLTMIVELIDGRISRR